MHARGSAGKVHLMSSSYRILTIALQSTASSNLAASEGRLAQAFEHVAISPSFEQPPFSMGLEQMRNTSVPGEAIITQAPPAPIGRAITSSNRFRSTVDSDGSSAFVPSRSSFNAHSQQQMPVTSDAAHFGTPFDRLLNGQLEFFGRQKETHTTQPSHMVQQLMRGPPSASNAFDRTSFSNDITHTSTPMPYVSNPLMFTDNMPTRQLGGGGGQRPLTGLIAHDTTTPPPGMPTRATLFGTTPPLAPSTSPPFGSLPSSAGDTNDLTAHMSRLPPHSAQMSAPNGMQNESLQVSTNEFSGRWQNGPHALNSTGLFRSMVNPSRCWEGPVRPPNDSICSLTCSPPLFILKFTGTASNRGAPAATTNNWLPNASRESSKGSWPNYF